MSQVKINFVKPWIRKKEKKNKNLKRGPPWVFWFSFILPRAACHFPSSRGDISGFWGLWNCLEDIRHLLFSEFSTAFTRQWFRNVFPKNFSTNLKINYYFNNDWNLFLLLSLCPFVPFYSAYISSTSSDSFS